MASPLFGQEFLYKAAMEARASDVEAKLAGLLEEKLLDKKNLKGRVLDTGVGYGGSYLALTARSDDVRGIESNKELAEMLTRHGIVPEDRLFVGNPLGYLLRQSSASIDLIAVLHLFSKESSLPIERFHREAIRVLRGSGQMLYTAEIDTSSGPFYSRRLRQLPQVNGTRALFIPSYALGPDNVLLLVTKD